MTRVRSSNPDPSGAAQVHNKWPAKLARLCADTPTVERLINVSCLGAELDSPSPRLASKARGDAAVQEAFPDATLVRCGPLVGNEDRFYNDLALWRYSNNGVPVIDGGSNMLQPVWVIDVAEAIYKSLEFEDAKGSTYELGGPERLSCAPPDRAAAPPAVPLQPRSSWQPPLRCSGTLAWSGMRWRLILRLRWRLILRMHCVRCSRQSTSS